MASENFPEELWLRRKKEKGNVELCISLPQQGNLKLNANTSY